MCGPQLMVDGSSQTIIGYVGQNAPQHRSALLAFLHFHLLRQLLILGVIVANGLRYVDDKDEVGCKNC